MKWGFLFTLQFADRISMISIEELYKIFLKYPVVSTDSRNIRQGSLFFALKGERFDGNSFATNALQQGASYAIVDDEKYAINDAFILVGNVLETLQELALYHRKQFNIPVIAITGTNGKTTTKELINAILSRKYKTIATSGNLNNHIGVPLTLLSVIKETQIAIIEMGANHQGEIDLLCKITLPTHGIITNIGKAHLDGFGGFEGVVKAKTELYNFLRLTNGIAFVHKNNSLLIDHTSGLKTITYGSDPLSAFTGSVVETDDPFLSILVSFKSFSMIIGSRLYGRYNFENILAATCIGYHFNVDPENIKAGIETYEPSNNRSQILDTGKNILILDAYNANPDSLSSAIQCFAASSFPHKTVLIGDMFELGKESDKEHYNILKLLENAQFKDVFLIGPIFTRLNTKKEWLCFQDSDLAKLWFDHHQLKGNTVLIKGSRGVRMEKLTDIF
jgi:UDP-N-acetylmuramoyl-tripeptide--D-alanyl-D-alanine ligase